LTGAPSRDPRSPRWHLCDAASDAGPGVQSVNLGAQPAEAAVVGETAAEPLLVEVVAVSARIADDPVLAPMGMRPTALRVRDFHGDLLARHRPPIRAVMPAACAPRSSLG
jgi:hypothetical protein